MTVPPVRELPLRDVRDLALAVVEGAVAAESLAKELRRTPDRSRHFQEIADRLRAIVARSSIRVALSDDGGSSVVLSAPLRPSPPAPAPPSGPQLIGPPVRPQAAPPPPPSSRPQAAPPPPPSSRPQVAPPTLPPASQEPPAPDLRPQLARIEEALRALAARDGTDALLARIARLEEALVRATSKREEGERYALRTPEEAIALAARLTERLRREARVVVHIEPGP